LFNQWLKHHQNLVHYIIHRLMMLIPVLFGVTFITYGLMYLSPSDPVEMLLQAQEIPVAESIVESMRSKAGLDVPYVEQYYNWLQRVLTGDMGVSLIDGQPVAESLALAIPKTLLLAGTAMLVTVMVAVPLGILSAIKQDGLTDYFIRLFSFISNALPNFIVSFLLLYLFAIKLKILPVLANSGVKGLILPTLALSIPMIGKYIRQVRAAVLEQLGCQYVACAMSRGIKERTILFFSVLRNALFTIVTLMGLSMGSLLGGTAAIERIFMWRGMGYMIMDAILMRDYPVIQAFVVWMSIIYVVVNLLTDLIHYLLDPRIRRD